MRFPNHRQRSMYPPSDRNTELVLTAGFLALATLRPATTRSPSPGRGSTRSRPGCRYRSPRGGGLAITPAPGSGSRGIGLVIARGTIRNARYASWHNASWHNASSGAALKVTELVAHRDGVWVVADPFLAGWLRQE